jgi:carbonic anhydrase
MNIDIIDLIRAQQIGLSKEEVRPPEHKPQMLLIGCVDARLNPKIDMGIPDGTALIHRNIAALVRSKPAPDDIAGTSVAASLEFAINVMEVKHIVVMGHTDCGGILACLEDNHTHDTQSIRKYLTPLQSVRDDVVVHGGDMKAQARAMEQAAVRQSVHNLLEYEVVQDALKDGRMDIHGWVINTATKRIMEMDLKTGQFSWMDEAKPAGRFFP